ncbi:PRTRC system protein C [Undibacterium oligocarboniphilum]|uniref:PRTRC system protein C n=1 Tax=Undibacterium oligocarboniphilum TaxID=666702 RepID=A0A850QSS8_9BURK|nr:PRTRC system protein C [Undibacterium oligocarboniphilum]MBC3871778.1 PRTRC system protein C [Undibacterium oligocarboniphilum]NVO79414.1 PRTRC system protein C [Undibacterium oligocarboniphilum]
MALEIANVIRFFVYNGTKLPDINPTFSVSKIAELYSAAYPELTNALIEGPVMKDGEAIFTFSKAAGGKG